MRSFKDRLRHTVLFELIALGIVSVGGGWILSRPVVEIGVLSVMFSALAMVWNLIFNWLFDLWDRKYRNMAKRGFVIRAAHASLFELGMIIAGLFLTVWWLDVGMVEAFFINLGFSVFFLVYAYLYNWAYDVIFPPPGQA